MTQAQFIVLACGLWAGAGLATMLWMARRGHRDPLWLLSAVVLGPVLALAAPELVERTPRVLSSVRHGTRAAGPRVLVGIDGSPESRAALQAVLDMLREQPGQLVLATVVDYDAAELDWRGRQETAQEHLDAARTLAAGHDLECEVHAGPPAQALAQCADQHGVDLIAVGRRGRGVSVRVLGSVAEDLVRRSPVPVLVAGVSAPVGPHEADRAREGETDLGGDDDAHRG